MNLVTIPYEWSISRDARYKLMAYKIIHPPLQLNNTDQTNM